MSNRYALIYSTVRRIPSGRVSTYGTVARLSGLTGGARQVGYALHALGDADEDVPWHRVVNAQGRISLGDADGVGGLQRSMLEHEGVNFDQHGRIDLARYGWQWRVD